MIPWRTAAVGVLLGVATLGWWRTTAELRAVLSTAEQQLARQDYQAAARTLDSAPPAVQADQRIQVLKARAYAYARERAGDRSGASPVADHGEALQGFRILIYPVAGHRPDEERAQALHQKLVELVPADVEVRPRPREFLDGIGPPLSDEVRCDTSLTQDRLAALALQAVLSKSSLGEFKLRHGSDRGAGTLYILFAGKTSLPSES